MSKIEDIERQLQALSSDELAQFRVCFLEFDWAVWDHHDYTGKIPKDTAVVL